MEMDKLNFKIRGWSWGFKIVIWTITILWMSTIFYFSSQPAQVSLDSSGEILVRMNQIEEHEAQNISDRRIWNLQYNIRKLAHFLIYLGLGFLMVLSIVAVRYHFVKSYVYAWAASSVYGVLDELHQNLIPGRGATFADIKLDAFSALAGVVLGVIFVEVVRRIKYISYRKQANTREVLRLPQ
jgi:VanZ family protein